MRHEPSAAADVERRAHVRVKVNASISAQPLGGDEVCAIQEVSIAGFSMTSSVPFAPESRIHFRILDAVGQVVLVGGTCRSCTPLDGSDAPSYLVGFQLESPPPRRVPLVLGVSADGAS